MYKRRYGKYISVKKGDQYERVEVSNIRPKRGTAWKRLRNYINSIGVGNIFTRKEMIQALIPSPESARGYQLTIDLYRRTITILEFLEIVTRGQYKVLQHIPDVAISRLTKMAYNDSWKVWFLKPEDW
jgi:hypothetical protein